MENLRRSCSFLSFIILRIVNLKFLIFNVILIKKMVKNDYIYILSERRRNEDGEYNIVCGLIHLTEKKCFPRPPRSPSKRKIFSSFGSGLRV